MRPYTAALMRHKLMSVMADTEASRKLDGGASRWTMPCSAANVMYWMVESAVAEGCDPEISSSKKGNQWHFGMKAHFGVDAESGLVHTGGVTTGGIHDAND